MKEINSLKIHSLKQRIECVFFGACIQEQNNFSKIQKILEQLNEKIRLIKGFPGKKMGLIQKSISPLIAIHVFLLHNSQAWKVDSYLVLIFHI